jgi:hypothetical protein
MKLRFHPRGDAQPFEPFAPMAVGQAKRYVGRRLNPKTGGYEAVAAPYECEAGSAQATRMGKHLRSGDVLPADAETASHFGVPFVAVELRDGAFAPAAKTTPKKDPA